ncbi:MAG TPA: hypothetical protein VN764_08860 [Polyangiaceae bacterium]|nr:hypothetical protein [Polyangiaceae bacterium]
MTKAERRLVRRVLGGCALAGAVAVSGAFSPARASDQSAEGQSSKARNPTARVALRCAQAGQLWQRVAGRGTRELCAQLDRARANLIRRPELALELAERVLVSRPGEEQALVLVAHAHFQLGKAADAYQEFLALAARAGDDPDQRPMHVVHLWARARAAAQVGEYEQARAWYRPLLLALEALPDSTQRACALVEAAWTSIYAGENYPEALAYLRRAQDEDAAIWREVAGGAELVVGALLGERPTRDSTLLYAHLAWLFEQEGLAPRRTLMLPKLGEQFLLAHLAEMGDRPRAALHLSALRCAGGLPLHLAASLPGGEPSSPCPSDEQQGEEWEGLQVEP